jgi:hypothetical protein
MVSYSEDSNSQIYTLFKNSLKQQALKRKLRNFKYVYFKLNQYVLKLTSMEK